MKFRVCLLLAAAVAALPAQAEPPAERPRDERPIVGAPVLTVATYPVSRLPSWDQAVDLSTGTFVLGHYAVARATEGLPPLWRAVARAGGVLVTDLLVSSEVLGVGPAWVHEEGHRAILARYDIPGHNGVLDALSAWKGGIPVYGMTDAQLSELKRLHNPDMVRLQAAGWETETNVRLALEKSDFFYEQPGYLSVPAIVVLGWSVTSYFSVCMNERQLVADATASDWTAPELRRDFTGPDCTGWVYDLHRPDEPYEARGPSPAGEGLRRDRLPSDLSAEEFSYLRRQRNLTLLNFVDPHLLGFAGFGGTDPLTGQPFRWSATVTHGATSFGSDTALHLLAAERDWKVAAALHGYANAVAVSPGVSLEVVRKPVSLWGHGLLVSGALTAWLQPRDQAFRTSERSPGAMLSVTVAQRLFDAMDVDLRLRAKTAGWVALHPSLEPAADAALGLRVLLP